MNEYQQIILNEWMNEYQQIIQYDFQKNINSLT